MPVNVRANVQAQKPWLYVDFTIYKKKIENFTFTMLFLFYRSSFFFFLLIITKEFFFGT